MSRFLKALRRRLQHEDGFTLIELLVVILIIGILAAVAIPLFLNQQSKANDSNAISTVKNGQIAMQTYLTSSNGVFPTGATAATVTTAIESVDPSLTAALVAGQQSGTQTKTGLAVTGVTVGFDTYTLTGYSAGSANTYTIAVAAGTESDTCTVLGSGSCPASGNWGS